MESYHHLPQQNVSIYISFTTLIKPVINITGNQKISSRSAVCDLGVVISSNLKWHQHVCIIVFKAFMHSHQILNCFNSNNVWILLKAYVTYIRPLLEYNTVIWSPFLKSVISMMESVQKRFTKKICFHCNIFNTSYSHHLNMLNLKSLEYRRVAFDLMFMYKINHGYVALIFSGFFSVWQSIFVPVHIYPPFTRKRIVSLYFGRDVCTRLGVAIFEVSGPPVFHIKAGRPIKCLAQGHNKRTCWLVLYNLP